MLSPTTLLLLAASIFLSTSVLAVTNIQDPDGKTVLVVDGDDIKSADGSKTLLAVTDDFIKDPAGNVVLYTNGDMIRNKPEGDLLLYVDGRHIKREPGGANLLYVDGKNLMRGDRSGKYLYKFAGDDLTRQREMAALYLLMPTLFTQGKAADAATLDAQTKSAAADDSATTKDFVPGNYLIDIYRASGTQPDLAGTVAITKTGDVFVMDFKIKIGAALQGVAIQHGDELWAAVGPPSTMGLAVYAIKGGTLTGTWYNATGKPDSFGAESATGSADLTGDYKITDAKAPFTHAPYAGTLTLNPINKKFFQESQIFVTAWDLAGYKAKGVGFATKDSLVIASSPSPEFSITRFKFDIKNGSLNGQFYTPTNTTGIWSLKKK